MVPKGRSPERPFAFVSFCYCICQIRTLRHLPRSIYSRKQTFRPARVFVIFHAEGTPQGLLLNLHPVGCREQYRNENKDANVGIANLASFASNTACLASEYGANGSYTVFEYWRTK
jgi:hypothetical protein